MNVFLSFCVAAIGESGQLGLGDLEHRINICINNSFPPLSQISAGANHTAVLTKVLDFLGVFSIYEFMDKIIVLIIGGSGLHMGPLRQRPTRHGPDRAPRRTGEGEVLLPAAFTAGDAGKSP